MNWNRYVQSRWAGDNHQWFELLGEERYLLIDYKSEFGGAELPRVDQIEFITAMAEHQCPLMPESITLLAPLLIALNEHTELLHKIQSDPLGWEPVSNKQANCYLDASSDTCFVTGQMLGSAGNASRLLTMHASPLWQLHEMMTTFAYLTQVQAQTSEYVSILAIKIDNAKARYLKESQDADRQICLMLSDEAYSAYFELFTALGYYALLETDERLNSNEQLPYSAERQHLRELRARAQLNQMIQRDMIYEKLT